MKIVLDNHKMVQQPNKLNIIKQWLVYQWKPVRKLNINFKYSQIWYGLTALDQIQIGSEILLSRNYWMLWKN